MSSFTDKLVVSKESKNTWKVEREFRYYVEEGEDISYYVTIPQGFITDFASVPRLFWAILPPDGEYTQAAVLHDYLYHKGMYSRKKSDMIFLKAMEVLEVSKWKRVIMHRAVRMFGWIPWNQRHAKKDNKISKENKYN